MSNLKEEQFLRNVSKHKMTVEFDDGKGNRRLYFGEGTSFYCHFRIVTFADYLLFTGDMGTFVFRRLKDMFGFFRGDGINPRYWSEKIEAADGCDGYMGFDFEHAMEVLRQRISDLPDDAKADIEDDFEYTEQDEWSFFETARSCKELPQSYWDDFSDRDIKVFTGRYLWCCRAIVWAISQYDANAEETK